jgi:hypothetical protein
MTLISANFHQLKKPALAVPDSVTPVQVQVAGEVTAAAWYVTSNER